MPWCEECSKYWTPNSMTDENYYNVKTMKSLGMG